MSPKPFQAARGAGMSRNICACSEPRLLANVPPGPSLHQASLPHSICHYSSLISEILTDSMPLQCTDGPISLFPWPGLGLFFLFGPQRNPERLAFQSLASLSPQPLSSPLSYHRNPFTASSSFGSTFLAPLPPVVWPRTDLQNCQLQIRLQRAIKSSPRAYQAQ